MKKFYTYILIFAILPAAFSCREDFPETAAPEDYPGESFSGVFEAYWNGMNNNYIFWDIDITDWDKVYRDYKPLFAELDINDSTDVRKSYTYFKEMTKDLTDSHYTLSFTSEWLKDSVDIDPSYIRKLKNPGFPQFMSFEHLYYTLPETYLSSGIRGIAYSERFETYISAVAGITDDEILYFNCILFDLYDLYYTEEDNDIKLVLQYFFDKLKTMNNLKGVILDVRSNAGGSAADLSFLLGHMTDKQYTAGYTRSKSGDGRLDYSAWAPAYVTPTEGAVNITVPVIALADSWSMSMAEHLTMAVKTLPDGHFIGERTWGAMGPLNNAINQNGGIFETSFFKSVYTSSLAHKYIDGKVYEGIGFSPDIEVKHDEEALQKGKDAQLERAFQLIREGK